jgi:hypothetical protein
MFQPLSLLTKVLLAREPALAAVVAALLRHGPSVPLVVDPKVVSTFPLQDNKVQAGPDTVNRPSLTPASGVPGEDNLAFKVAPVDLKLYVAEGDGAEGSSTGYLARVEITL